jgi:choice-of-anchor C domain-containing protein
MVLKFIMYNNTPFIIAVLLFTGRLLTAQSVVNGSFELGVNPGVSANLDAVDSTTIIGWTVVSGSIDYIGSRWVAGDGSRCLDLSGVDAGSIQQTISGFELGHLYHLSFLLAGNPEAGPFPKNMNVAIGSASEEYVFSGVFNTSNLGWSERFLDFTASASSLTLSFQSLNPGFSGPALDRVSIIPVPEPGVLVLGALGLIVVAARWRTKASA